MAKAFKWFFGILIMVVIVGVILFLAGFMKIKFRVPGGADVQMSISDISEQGLVDYMVKDLGCSFDGFAFNFKNDDEDYNAYNEIAKDYIKQSKKHRLNYLFEDDEDDDWDEDW